MHASSAIVSYSHFLQLLGDNMTRQSRDVWFVLLSFLTHAAMVSKFLDPIHPKEAKKERGEALRAHLGIADDSVLLTRDARDNLEHIDERIDRWVQRGDTKILEMVFENRAGFDYICEHNGAIRRVLIADEMVFVSEDRHGKRIETSLRPVFESLQVLRTRCAHKLLTESPYTLFTQAVRDHAR